MDIFDHNIRCCWNVIELFNKRVLSTLCCLKDGNFFMRIVSICTQQPTYNTYRHSHYTYFQIFLEQLMPMWNCFEGIGLIYVHFVLWICFYSLKIHLISKAELHSYAGGFMHPNNLRELQEIYTFELIEKIPNPRIWCKIRTNYCKTM